MRKVPFMPTEHIEAAGLRLLAEYGRKYGEVVAPPVPVEEILEAHLGLGLEFDDLPGRVGVPDVLGATWIQDRRVLRVAAELIDHVGGSTPVGVDETSLDAHGRAVIPPPFPREVLVRYRFQPGVDRPFQPRALGGALERPPRVA